jgi:hypothetical protein
MNPDETYHSQANLEIYPSRFCTQARILGAVKLKNLEQTLHTIVNACYVVVRGVTM